MQVPSKLKLCFYTGNDIQLMRLIKMNTNEMLKLYVIPDGER